MKGKYYVYALYDKKQVLPEPDEFGLRIIPFYIGKGTGIRATVHTYNAKRGYSHNPYLLKRINQIQNSGSEVLIEYVKYSDNEMEIYEKEHELIEGYGLEYKGGILVNAGSGKAGGWGGRNNPTFSRIKEGTHNFLGSSNPQFMNPKIIKLNNILEEMPSGTDITKGDWLVRSGYLDKRSFKLGLFRLIKTRNLPYKLENNIILKD